MPPRINRRQVAEDSPVPSQSQTRRRQETSEDDEDVDMDEVLEDRGSGSLDQLSKALVRYALSCEYARKPIKRQDVNDKVLGSHARMFKDVFVRANADLMEVFGMQLVELPKAERVTLRQKRAAAASESQSKTSNMWVLRTVLPEEYRLPSVVGPSRPLDEDADENMVNKEDSYVGLYTMVIALITISGGMLPEGKLDRSFRRMNADHTTPLGSKEKTLATMVKDGYIVKIKDSSTGEEMVDYIVGPRGRVEVGREGVANLIRLMYGEGEGGEELEARIQRTLDIAETYNSTGSGAVGEAADGAPSQSQAVGRKRGRPRREEDE